MCGLAGDCLSNLCTAQICRPPPTCRDDIRNGDETDVDCGGPVCPRCLVGEQCLIGTDCITLRCTSNVCAPQPVTPLCTTDADCLPGHECTDRVIETDTTWVQTRTPAVGWHQLTFDDSSWLPSVIEQPVTMPGTWPTQPPMPAGTRANWIWYWDSRFVGDTSTVYFRRSFVAPPTGTTLYVTADDEWVAYLNGAQVAAGSLWSITSIIPMATTPSTPYVLAVRAQNNNGPGGLAVDLRASAKWCRPIDDAGTSDAGLPDAGPPQWDGGTGGCTCAGPAMLLPHPSVFMSDPQPIGNLAAGNFCWWWIRGAFQYANGCWIVTAVNPGYQLIDMTGGIVSQMTGGSGCPPNQASAEATHPAAPLSFSWGGGPLRITLYDSDYSGNATGNPDTTFGLCRAP